MVGLKTLNLSVLPAEAPLQIEEAADGVRIHVPPGCQASLIESVPSTLRVTLAENAHVTHYRVIEDGPVTDSQSFLEVDVGKSASFASHVFLFGGAPTASQGLAVGAAPTPAGCRGAHVRNTIHVRLSGEEAACTLNGLYWGRGEQEIETHTLIDHIKPRGTSRELYKGILDDKAQGLFDGLILVQKDAQKTDSIQTNKNLLLSPEAKAHSNPELKILANDVKCKHGATIGQIDPAQLFYLRSRGLSETGARRLLVYAFASEMIEKVEIPALRERLVKLIHV